MRGTIDTANREAAKSAMALYKLVDMHGCHEISTDYAEAHVPPLKVTVEVDCRTRLGICSKSKRKAPPSNELGRAGVYPDAANF